MLFVDKIVNFFKPKSNPEDTEVWDVPTESTEDVLEHWIRQFAYLNAEADGFRKPPEEYWIETEQKLKNYDEIKNA